MINQRSWHTAISRARQRMRIFTDCVELIEQRATNAGERGSALAQASDSSKATVIERQVALQAGESGR